jgi:hypothetical protein
VCWLADVDVGVLSDYFSDSSNALEFHAGDLIGSEHRQECLNARRSNWERVTSYTEVAELFPSCRQPRELLPGQRRTGKWFNSEGSTAAG